MRMRLVCDEPWRRDDIITSKIGYTTTRYIYMYISHTSFQLALTNSKHSRSRRSQCHRATTHIHNRMDTVSIAHSTLTHISQFAHTIWSLWCNCLLLLYVIIFLSEPSELDERNRFDYFSNCVSVRCNFYVCIADIRRLTRTCAGETGV